MKYQPESSIEPQPLVAYFATITVLGMTAAFALAHFGSSEPERVFFDNVQWTIANAGAALLAWLGTRRRGDLDQAARQWFARAFGCYALGQAIWDIQVWVDWQPFPAPSDLFYAACGPLVAVGIWHSTRCRISAARLRPMLLNMGILLIQLLTLVLMWYLPKTSLGWLPLLQLCVYPVVMLGCVIMIVVMALELSLALHWRWLLLPTGLLISGFAWMRWNLLDLAGNPASGSWLNYSFAVASVLHGLGSMHWDLRPALPQVPQRVEARLLVQLPVIMVLVAVVTVMLAWDADDLSSSARVAVLLSSAVVIVLSVVRQNLWLTERDRLLQLERQQTEQQRQYQALARRLELATASGQLGVWDITPNSRHAVWNEQMYTFFGYDSDTDKAPYDIWDQCALADDAARIKQILTRAVQTRGQLHAEYRIVRTDGDLRNLESSAVIECDEKGEPVRIIGITWDVTEAVRARRALADSEAELRAIFDNSVVGVVLIDQQRRIVRSNAAVRQFMGYPTGKALGVYADSILHPEDLVASQAQFAKLLSGEIKSYQAERRYRRGDGAYRWVRVSVYPIQLNADPCFVVLIEDIEEHRQIELALQEAQEKQLRMHEEFAYRLLDVQEQERQRLANELHDGLGQNLSVIKNRTQLALENAVPGSALETQLTAVLHVTVEAIAEARGLAHNLRPLHIEQLGLTSALVRLLEQFEQAGRIHIVSRIEPVDDAFKPEQVTHIYRLVQEALTNIDKHAQASRVTVNVERDLHVVRIIIHDNGVGFVSERVEGGLGLSSMTERTRMLSGKLQVTSEPGQGTRIYIELPVQDLWYETSSDVI